MLVLNRSNLVTGYYEVSRGSMVGTIVCPKIVTKVALDSMASGVILMHNHPSGNLDPSESDLSITENIKKALKLFEITLIDHFIVTEDSYYSFLNEGKL